MKTYHLLAPVVVSLPVLFVWACGGDVHSETQPPQAAAPPSSTHHRPTASASAKPSAAPSPDGTASAAPTAAPAQPTAAATAPPVEPDPAVAETDAGRPSLDPEFAGLDGGLPDPLDPSKTPQGVADALNAVDAGWQAIQSRADAIGDMTHSLMGDAAVPPDLPPLPQLGALSSEGGAGPQLPPLGP